MLKRRELLRAGAALPAVTAASTFVDADARNKKKRRRKRKNRKKNRNRRDFTGMNVVLFMTDQERATMHFPKGWEEQNLPGTTRLKKNGLTFNRAFCSTCMCSPSRATLFTGYFPAQHGVKYTLEEENNEASLQVPLPMPDEIPNLATVMKEAGYSVPYKGKFHLVKKSEGQGGDWVPQDVEQYGWERWNPPDAGANQDIDQFGGGDPDNDGRYMDNLTPAPGYPEYESVLDYLKSDDAKDGPFFLIVSLVNPHDVLAYPAIYDQPGAGYDDSDLQGNISTPSTYDENLDTKPTAQKEFAAKSQLIGPIPVHDIEKQENYLNFYGNVIKESDNYLVQILDTLEDEGLLDDTLVIKTSDHGEMGMTHHVQRQKMFNFYEETLRVPLVFSNPKLFPKARTTNAMVSHVDFLPTMASLLGVPQSARENWQGANYSKVLRKPQKKKGPQKYVVFTYDDIQAGQTNLGTDPFVNPPNHIVSIREGRYKLARYYDEAGVEEDQWEMYDLKHDKLETNNLAWPGAKLNKKHRKELNRLKNKLAQVEETRLQPL